MDATKPANTLAFPALVMLPRNKPLFYLDSVAPEGYLRDKEHRPQNAKVKIMSSFDDREKSFERKAVHEDELEFKARARRNKLLAHWVAEKLGIADVDAYAAEVIKSDLEEAGDEDVFRKVRSDLDAKSVDVSDHQLRREMDELLTKARDQIQSE